MNDSTTAAPLAGVRVLDFTHVLAGPFCTRLLADLGADVVRVESSKHPDHPWPSAHIGTDGRHASYLNTNRNKRSIAIDLKHPSGRQTAVNLAARADVVVENFSAGVMDRLGLGYETLRSRNQGIISVSMSGYGHDGPRRGWTSMNMNLQGYSGLMTVTGAEGDPPTAISNSWNDYIGGLHACFAIVQALDERGLERHRHPARPEPVRVQRRDDRAVAAWPAPLPGGIRRAWVTARRASRPRGFIAAPAPTTGAPSACELKTSGAPSDESSAKIAGQRRSASRQFPAASNSTTKSTSN